MRMPTRLHQPCEIIDERFKYAATDVSPPPMELPRLNTTGGIGRHHRCERWRPPGGLRRRGADTSRGTRTHGEAVRTGSWNRRTKPEWPYTVANGMDGSALARFLKWLVRGIVQAFSGVLAGCRHSHDCASPSRGRGRASHGGTFMSAIWSHRIRARSPRTNGTLDGSTPAFDLRGDNPIGWRRDVGGEAEALGPIEWLPPDVEARRGTLSRYTAQAAPNPSFTGTLLTKMDDDVYGADHLWDLVLAREYSGAQLVGKRLEFVYLAASDRTLRWFNGGGERYQTSALAGGTLLIARDGLDRCGGWRKVQGGVDTALAEDVRRARLPHPRRWVHDDSARLPPYLGRQGWFGRRPSRQSRARLARVPAWPASRLRACRASGADPGRNAVFTVKEALPSPACSTCLRVPDWYSRGLFEACRAARWAVGLLSRPSPRVLGRMNENSPTGRSRPRRIVRGA